MLEALARGADERRLLIRSFDEEEQAALDGAAVGGALVDQVRRRSRISGSTSTTAPARRCSTTSSTTCAWTPSGAPPTACSSSGDGSTSRPPPPEGIEEFPDYITGGGTLFPAGTQFLGLVFYAPRDGQIGDFELDGEEFVPDFPTVDRGRPAVGAGLQFAPGESRTITWKVRSGPGQPGDGRLEVTPGAQPGSESGRVRSACGR